MKLEVAWCGVGCCRTLCGLGTKRDVGHVVGAVGEGAVELRCGGAGHDGIEVDLQGNIA